MRKISLMVLVLVLVVLLSGCYVNKQIEANEIGLSMHDGSSIDAVRGPGRHTDWGYFAKLKVIDVSAKTIEWEDPDLVTADKQPIGLRVGLTYQRMKDSESATFLYSEYNSEAVSDEALARQILNRIPRVAKEITAQYELDELLGVDENSDAGRAFITNELFDLLEPELLEVRIRLLDVGINNIAPSADYLSLLQQKANAQVSIEVAQERTKELNEQLAQEVAQTAIDVEVANRANRVNEEKAKAYENSPELLQLEMARIQADMLSGKAQFWFVPQGTPLNLLMNATGATPTLVQP